LPPPAPSAVSSKRSVSARSTSRVWVPIEPVDPARATRVALTGVQGTGALPPKPLNRRSTAAKAAPVARKYVGLDDAQNPEHVEGRRQHEQHAVESVEQTAVGGQQRAHVLDAEITLQQ
jgi:hypothetical protein